MRRREVIAALAATALPAPTRAQQSTKLARIGFLGPAPAANFAPRVDALRVGFRGARLHRRKGPDLQLPLVGGCRSTAGACSRAGPGGGRYPVCPLFGRDGGLFGGRAANEEPPLG